MFSAKITFRSRQEAQEFSTSWGRWSKRGHTLSATKPDGSADVSLDGVTPTDKQWINNQISMMNAKAERETA
jgi:hypothetical protein